MIIDKKIVHFTMCMKSFIRFIFCVSLMFPVVFSQATRINMGAESEEEEMTAKQIELAERKQEIELMTIEAEMEAQARSIQDSIRIKQYYGYDFLNQMMLKMRIVINMKICLYRKDMLLDLVII